MKRSGSASTSGHAGGFTLVELVLVVVVTGLLVVIASRGFAVLESSKVEQLVLQVQQFDRLAKEHRRMRLRWPGDCNGDGLIDASLSHSGDNPGYGDGDQAARAERFDYTGAAPFASPGTSSTSVAGNGCPGELSSLLIVGADGHPDFNLPFNDLKLAGLLSSAQPNRVAAMHAAGDFFALTSVLLNTPPTGAMERTFNALVLFNVPLSHARRLAVAINGHDGDSAYLGRLRRLDVTSASSFKFHGSWQAQGESVSTRITVAYFFDRVPVAHTY